MVQDISTNVPQKTNFGGSNTMQRAQSSRAAAIIERYPTIAQFDAAFSLVKHPDYYMPANAERCHAGNAPTLYALRDAYDAAFRVWLVDLVAYLAQMMGCRDKLFAGQEVFIVNLFLDKGYIKVSELLLFVTKYLAGDYGATYGNLDPQKIGVAFNLFLQERREALQRIENRAKEQAREKNRQGGISFEEYQRQQAAKGANVPALNLGGVTKKV